MRLATAQLVKKPVDLGRWSITVRLKEERIGGSRVAGVWAESLGQARIQLLQGSHPVGLIEQGNSVS